MTFKIYVLVEYCEDNYYPDYKIVKAYVRKKDAEKALKENYCADDIIEIEVEV